MYRYIEGVLPDAELQAFVDKAVAQAAAHPAAPKVGAGAGVMGDGAAAAAAPPQDPAVLVAGAFAALDGGLPTAKEDAARAFSHVLAADTVGLCKLYPSGPIA